MQSIIDNIKTKNFTRIRIGIKNKKPAQMPVEKYVLQNFNKDEMPVINQVINNTSQIIT